MEDTDLEILRKVVRIEKRKMNIPEGFAIEVYEGYPKPFEHCCKCEPIESMDKRVVGARIKINYEHSLLGGIYDLLHEIKHGEGFYLGKNVPEIVADIYAFRKIWKYILSYDDVMTVE